jgi:hypothetical protein
LRFAPLGKVFWHQEGSAKPASELKGPATSSFIGDVMP